MYDIIFHICFSELPIQALLIRVPEKKKIFQPSMLRHFSKFILKINNLK